MPNQWYLRNCDVRDTAVAAIKISLNIISASDTSDTDWPHWYKPWIVKLTVIGGHSVRYPWSAISDWAWYRNVRYRTEEHRVRHYIGYRNNLFSDIRYPTSMFVNLYSEVVSCLVLFMKVVGSKPKRTIMGQNNLLEMIINFRYRNIRYWFSPISEWKLMSISELFRYRNERI